MKSEKKSILIKLTGNLFVADEQNNNTHLLSVIRQIKELSQSLHIGIVVGGGNYFRGSVQGKQLGMRPWYAHTVGMFATVMNGLVLADLCEQQQIPCTLLSAIPGAQAGNPITPEAIAAAKASDKIMIFSGGTGNPYFTTDTNAVLRALQIGAKEIWKTGNADGVYDRDPQKDATAQLLKKVSFAHAIEQKLGIMDLSALALADEHDLRIRVFSLFNPNALLVAARDEQFGSIIEQ